MRRYRFPLQSVLRVRQIEQDAARGEFIAAHLGHRAADERRQDLLEHYQARPHDTGAETMSSWLHRRLAAERAAASVVAAEAETADALARMQDQLAALQAARMRTSALERLDARRREEYELESRRAEDAEVDELVTARHGRQW